MPGWNAVGLLGEHDGVGVGVGWRVVGTLLWWQHGQVCLTLTECNTVTH